MTQTVEDIRYQLEEWLAQGFTSSEDRANYQALKEQYEDETLDYSFSKREIIGQLDIIITTRENDFPDLDEVTKEAEEGRCRGIHVPNFLRLGPDRRGDHGVRRRARHHLRHRFRRADSQYRQQLRCPTADRAGHGHA